MIAIKVIGGADALQIRPGSHVYDVMQAFPEAFPVHPKGYPAVGCTINNFLCALSDTIDFPCEIQLIYYDTVIGGDIYRHTLVFILGMAFQELYPEYSLQISHAINCFFYFYVQTSETDKTIVKIDETHIKALDEKMHEIVEADLPILSQKPFNSETAIDIFKKQNHFHSVSLLRSKNETRVMLSQCKNYYQIAHSPLLPLTSMAKIFKLEMVHNRIVLCYPSTHHPERLNPFVHNAAYQSIYEEYGRWASVMGIQSVGALNAINRSEKYKSYIQVCESRQNQMLSQVCNLILNGHKSINGPMCLEEAIIFQQNQQKDTGIVVGNLKRLNDQIKLVMISGPSSSGKTTFAKKIQYSLQVQGRTPLVLSMDNYFVNREDTPLGEDGKWDFEHVDAVDQALFNEHLDLLLRGCIANTPIFDFKTGKRLEKTVPMTLTQRGIIIIEGIHALNPIMTRSVAAENKFGIFIQPLPCIKLDDMHRLSTRDYRLVRRIIRDRKYRGCSAEKTIQLFDNVRKGEDRWIFPHQQRADIYFNTALDYELPVLATLVVPQLHEISPSSPYYTEGRRLLGTLEWVQGINQDYIPKHSLLREFIGGSGFSYD